MTITGDDHELRVDQLAALCQVSVDTIRFYQSRGLLPPPLRKGRIALYGSLHAQRLERIRALAGEGLTLATIKRLLDGDLDRADAALASALSEHLGSTPARGGQITIEELARRCGVPIVILAALEKEGLLIPRLVDGQSCYTEDDAAMVGAGLVLLQAGLPIAELMNLAREHDGAMRRLAERAVAMFDDHVRHPLRSSNLADADAATQLVAAFNAMLPATVALVAHHFQRSL
ncbi:MAG: MerR family transcriptional regulator, partial [Acidimicrobiales bacterium]